MPASQPEPWLRNSHTELPVVVRAVTHALEHAKEDIDHWCGQLSQEQLEAQPHNLPSAAFQMRHIAGSLDRLLAYAEGNVLSTEQLKHLKAEADPGRSKEASFIAFHEAIAHSLARVANFIHSNPEEKRTVGRAQLPVTLGDLLVHIAEHTQRHVGQAITTTKVLLHSAQTD
ncbi:MAG: DinB family protein [Acidobacteria bacterium]|nr:DinB family protein [Acidobacteriota bacterium]